MRSNNTNMKYCPCTCRQEDNILPEQSVLAVAHNWSRPVGKINLTTTKNKPHHKAKVIIIGECNKNRHPACAEAQPVQKGIQEERKTFTVIYKQFLPVLKKYLAVFGNTKEYLNDDISHDIFLKLWQQRNKLHLISSLDNYLFLTVKNYLANDKAHAIVEEKALKYLEVNTPAHSCITEDNVLFNETYRVFLKSIDQLPTRAKQAYELKEMQGLKTSEIALVMGISKSSVKTHICKATTRLRALVSEHCD